MSSTSDHVLLWAVSSLDRRSPGAVYEYWAEGQDLWVGRRDLGYERFCLHGDNVGVLQLLLDKVANGAAEKAISTVRGLARTHST